MTTTNTKAVDVHFGNEWGIFNDEGQVEGGFYDEAEARAAVADRYDDCEDDDLYLAPCCHDHPEEEAEGCRECPDDDADDDQPEDDEE